MPVHQTPLGPVIHDACPLVLAYDASTRATKRIRLAEEQLEDVMRRVRRHRPNLPPSGRPPNSSRVMVSCTNCFVNSSNLGPKWNASATVRAAQERLSALTVFHRKSILYGAFVWERRALSGPFRWFSARAGVQKTVWGPGAARGRPRLAQLRWLQRRPFRLPLARPSDQGCVLDWHLRKRFAVSGCTAGGVESRS